MEEKGRAASVGITEKTTKAKAPASEGGRYEGKGKEQRQKQKQKQKQISPSEMKSFSGEERRSK